MIFAANHDLCSYGSILRLIALIAIRLDRCSAWISSLCGFGAHMIMSFAIIAFARSNAKIIAVELIAIAEVIAAELLVIMLR